MDTERPPAPQIKAASAAEVAQLRIDVAAKTANRLKQELLDLAQYAGEIKAVEENLIRRDAVVPRFEGNANDTNTDKGKANSVKKAVQSILLGGLTGKIPLPDGTPVGNPPTPGTVTLSNTIIERISQSVDPEHIEISDEAAPYLYILLNKILTGEVKNIENLAFEFNKLTPLQIISPGIYRNLQDCLVSIAVDYRYDEKVAKEKFKLREDETKSYNPRTGGYEEKKVIFEPGENRRLNEYSFRISQAIPNDTDREAIFDSLRSGVITANIRLRLINDVGLQPQEISELTDLMFKASKYSRDSQGFYPGLDEYIPEGERKKFKYQYLTGQNFDGPNNTGIVYLNEHGLTNEGKHMLRLSALRAVNQLFAKADAEPGVEFEKNFSEFHEGYYLRDIKQIILDLQNDPNLRARYGGDQDPRYREIREWIKEGLFQEVGREKEYRTLFHNIGIWIKVMKPEQIAEHIATHNTSEATSFLLSDVSGKILSMAMSAYESYMAYDMGINNGKVRPGLFSGKVNATEMYYEEKDKRILKESLIETILALREYADGVLDQNTINQLKAHGLTQYDLESLKYIDLDWEVDRALKFARAIHLTQTLRLYEIPASGKAYKGFEGSAEGIYNMIANLNPSWKWNLGRGAPGTRMMHQKEILVAEGIAKKPKESLFARIFDTSWNPKRIHDQAESYSEGKMAEKWEKLKDTWLYKDMSFRQLLSEFNLGGLGGRAGWRLVGFKDNPFERFVIDHQNSIITQLKLLNPNFDFSSASWEEKYLMLGQVAGVGTRFWFDSNRATDFVKKLLWEKLRIDPNSRNSQQLAELWKQYTTGKKGDQIVFREYGQELTVLDLVEAKMTVFEGKNFYDLLKRSPLDFLNSFNNLSPYILDSGDNLMAWILPNELVSDTEKKGSPDYYFHFGNNGGVISESELRNYLTQNRVDYLGRQQAGLTGKELNDAVYNTLLFQRWLKKAWGEDNFRHIKFIREFYEKSAILARNKNMNKEDYLTYFYKKLKVASEKVKLRQDIEMHPDDIDDPELRELLFGANGLISYFNNLNENFGITGSNDTTLGEKGFFYHMARTWYNELGTSLHPSTADVDWRFVFNNLGERAGENIAVRLWGDLAGWNEVTNKLMNIDHMLRDAAVSGSLDEIIKFQKEMHDKLEGISGKDEMYRKQYFLTQVVIRYFQQAPATRLPFPLNAVYSFFNGRELSLSRIYNGVGAMTLTTDGINAYLQRLRDLQIIQPEGEYGFKRLAKSMGADWPKLLISETIPNIAIMLALFMLWKFINQSLKESEGKKK